MTEATERIVETGGTRMRVLEQGEGPAVVLCHGFPELGYSWRHQLPALAEAGYHAIAPDQRGYGGTDAPGEVDAYDIIGLTDDLLALLDALGEESAVFAGHDWGAPVVWTLAQRVPERVRAVVAMSVPFTRRSRLPPTERMRELVGDGFFYILYFQPVGPADKEFDADPRRALLGMFEPTRPQGFADLEPGREGDLFGRLEPPSQAPQWLGEEALARYVSEFDRTGFSGGLNWYRNIDRNWELTEGIAEAVNQPALFIAGEKDYPPKMIGEQDMDECVADLRGKVYLDGAGHYIQQERPQEVNRLLLDFLAEVAPADGR